MLSHFDYKIPITNNDAIDDAGHDLFIQGRTLWTHY